ncbi:MAG: TetR/AcrR family transcriptional regulator [Clostridia bacterium]|nr:TetR/AcrR family transcriptional regulator [Clostridia bacterium]
MPPKVKITKMDIIETALELVRQSGEAAINARSVASALGCSTQPVFSNFATIEELKSAVLSAAYERYRGFLEREVASGKYPQYKAFGMAYVRFAKEERELFKLLFMCDRNGEELIPTTDFEESVEIIMNSNGVSKEKAERMHFEVWVWVHGIATMLATSFLELDYELISKMVTDVYMGIRARHLSEEN